MSLWQLAARGDTAGLRELLDAGVDVDARNSKGWTALMRAAQKGHDECLRLLLDRGADVNLQNHDGVTAMMLVADKGHDACLRLLLPNPRVARPLVFYACAITFIMYVIIYAPDQLESGIQNQSINHYILRFRSLGFWYPLRLFWKFIVGMSFLRSIYDPIALVWLDRGVNINLQNTNGRTALMYAAANGHEACIHVLLGGGAVVNLQGNDGWSALMCACIRRLLPNPRVAHTLLGVAAVSCSIVSYATMYIDLVPDYVTIRFICSWAAWKGHVASLRILLDKGVDINLRDNDGENSLMLAAWEGHDACLRLLLDRGADVNLQARDEWTALMLAAWKGHDTCLRLLLKNPGADVNLQARDEWTALMLAAWKGHDSSIRLLLEKCMARIWSAGRQVDGVMGFINQLINRYSLSSPHGGLPKLFMAARQGRGACLRILVNNEADLDEAVFDFIVREAVARVGQPAHEEMVDVIYAHVSTPQTQTTQPGLSDPAMKQGAMAWFKRRMNDTKLIVRTLYEYKLFIVLGALVVMENKIVTFLRNLRIFFRDLTAANRRHTWKDASLKGRIDTLKYKVNHGEKGSFGALDVIIKDLVDRNIMCSNPDDGNVAIDTLLKMVQTAIKHTSNPKKLPIYEGYMAKIMKIASEECRS